MYILSFVIVNTFVHESIFFFFLRKTLTFQAVMDFNETVAKRLIASLAYHVLHEEVQELRMTWKGLTTLFPRLDTSVHLHISLR